MAERFSSPQEIDAFLATPRLAMLLYHGAGPAPTGVPVWFDWDGTRVQMFAGRTSPKIRHLRRNPDASVLVTNQVGEPEGWVAFDGRVRITDFTAPDWQALLDRVAPRYWDMAVPAYAEEIERWRGAPEAFVALGLTPNRIRSGA